MQRKRPVMCLILCASAFGSKSFCSNSLDFRTKRLKGGSKNGNCATPTVPKENSPPDHKSGAKSPAQTDEDAVMVTTGKAEPLPDQILESTPAANVTDM